MKIYSWENKKSSKRIYKYINNFRGHEKNNEFSE